MLIQVFGHWINPDSIAYLIKYVDNKTNVVFNTMGIDGYGERSAAMLIIDATPDEVILEIREKKTLPASKL